MADNVFFKALEAHTNWKIRLRKHLDGTSEEVLDPDVVCKDNQCTLGQWIYGEGANYQDIESYAQLKQVHADFHQCAADIIRKKDSGAIAEAETQFSTTYNTLSRAITKILVAMNSLVKKSGAA